MGNQSDSNNELTRAAARSYYKVSRNLTGPTKVPPAPSVPFDSIKNARRQAYASVESFDVPLSALAISSAEQQEHMADIEGRLKASTKDMRALLDYEEQRVAVTSTVKEAIVYTLLAMLLLAAAIGLGYASHLGADAIINAGAEVMPR